MCGAANALECRADFIPGRLYVAAATPGCQFGYPNDRIYEFDPVTGSSRIFAEVPDGLCGIISGLAFSPDGSRLITSSYFGNALVQIDGAGGVSLAHGPADGVSGPAVGLAFDRAGNLFAANHGTHSVNRYPADGGTPTIIADVNDGVSAAGPIALSPAEDLYFSPITSTRVYRFTQDGGGGLFDQLDATVAIYSMVAGGEGTLYALTNAGTYRYLNGDAGSRELFSSFAGQQGSTTLALSAGGTTLFSTFGRGIFAIDLASGGFSQIGSIPQEVDYLPGAGLAVYVPEPATATLFFIVSFVAFCGRMNRPAL